MSTLTRELVFLILQFLAEEEFIETAQKLEQESGFFFDMEYFAEEVYDGNWDKVERYISYFTKRDDNWFSTKTFFKIRRQKYLEALNECGPCGWAKAEDILEKELNVFGTFNQELFDDFSLLFTSEILRENKKKSGYGDTESMREVLMVELEKLFEANPLFHDKLEFPNMKVSRLRTLINQGLNWQHQLCENPMPNPDIKTLFVDHSCEQPNGAHAPSLANNSLPGSLPKAGQFPHLGAHGGRSMSVLTRELVFLILQFLEQEGFKETICKLEQESGVFFNMRYFEEKVHSGNWDDVETYLSGFTKVDSNQHSLKMFFEIRKQKNLEELDGLYQSKAEAKDLKVFATFDEELSDEFSQLLKLENSRKNELSKYGDIKSEREIILVELKKLIEANPLFLDKLQFPYLRGPRLRTLINQGLNWQHHLCENPMPNPDVNTLFVDHSCGQPNGANAPTPANNLLEGSLHKVGGFHLASASSPFLSTPAQSPNPLGNWPPTFPIGNWPRTFPIEILPVQAEPAMDIALGTSDQVNRPVNVLPVTFPGHTQSQAFNAPYDLPKTVIRTFIQGSSPMSMDFHPVKETLLLVGTNVGDIGLWEVACGERMVLRSFQVWDIGSCSMTLQAALVKDPCVSVNRVAWSPDGSLFGIAYSRNIVQIYSYHGGDFVKHHLEIEAHVGGVNDIAFSFPNEQLCIVTCGDDKTIKVWDAGTGTKQYTLEGHEAPVYSVLPSNKQRIQFIYSTSLDGKIKAWLYDNLGSRADCDAPCGWCTTMASCDDGTGWGLNRRLFSCGTSTEGETFMVEWNENEGTVKKTYEGFRRRCLGVVQFDITRNRFLAAGDDYSIKFWDMDNVQLLASIDADGGLPATPRIRFNKDGTLLAVSTREYGIKILANSDGNQLLGISENLSYNASRTCELVTKPTINHQISTAAVAAAASGLPERVSSPVPICCKIYDEDEDEDEDAGNLGDAKTRLMEETNDKSTMWKLTESQGPSLHQPAVSFLELLRKFKIYDRVAVSYKYPTKHLKPTSLKDGLLDKLKSDWKKVAMFNIILLLFLILIYSLGCCAFGNNREYNAYRRWK